MTRLNKDFRTVDAGLEIVAHDASDIQPAIDEISENVQDGNVSGGIVQLKPKAYYPESTIWLKRGVVLRGARPWPQEVNPSAHGDDDLADTQSTTLYTSELPEGSGWSLDPQNGAHTYRHFDDVDVHNEWRSSNGDKSEAWMRDNTHPHLPVVSALTQQPLDYYNSVDSYTAEHWGDGVGMMNLKIHADQQRYWDPSSEPSGSKREKYATYFGVYDGFLFEDLEFLHLSNVEVTGFDGYTAFYQDIQEVVSRGNHYSGTATDHHGSALVLSHSNSGLNRYMRGIWDVKVSGPTPTVQVDNHSVRSKFVSGANIKNTIVGTEPRFIGSEADYDAGRAPIVDPMRKRDVVSQKDGYVTWNGYQIEGPGGVGGDYDPPIGYRAEDSNILMQNMMFRNVKHGIHGVTQEGISVSDSRIGATDSCVYLDGGMQGSWHNVYLTGGATNGITFQGKEGADGSWIDVKFTDVDVGISGDLNDRHVATFVRPYLSGASTPIESSFEGSLLLVAPEGYKNAHRQLDTLSANGSSRSFSISHGMDETPQHVSVSPKNGAARSNGPISWSADDTQVTFTFESAPASDPAISWVAQGWSHPDLNKQGS